MQIVIIGFSLKKTATLGWPIFLVEVAEIALAGRAHACMRGPLSRHAT
jgi:hypothetical protein